MTRSLVKETVLIPRPQLLETGYIKTLTELHIDRAIGLQTCIWGKSLSMCSWAQVTDDMMFLSASKSSFKISFGIEVHHHKMMHSDLPWQNNSQQTDIWDAPRSFWVLTCCFWRVFRRWFLHIFSCTVVYPPLQLWRMFQILFCAHHVFLC